MLSKLGEKEELLNAEHSDPKEGVVVLQQTNQLVVSTARIGQTGVVGEADSQGIMTILRDKQTSRGDFIFYADRLSTLIVEKALELIPHKSKSVRTPVGLDYDGVTQTDDVSWGKVL